MRARVLALALAACAPPGPATPADTDAPVDSEAPADTEPAPVDSDPVAPGDTDVPVHTDAPAPRRLVFQCAGLAGGICAIDEDGADRVTLRATGRSPDVAPDGTLLLHTDTYEVVRRDPSGDEVTLGDGAFARWADDGSVVFQCDGLGGGLCRMDRDGRNRRELVPTGRVPDPGPGGAVLFHTDGWKLRRREPGGDVVPLGDGAFPRFAPGGLVFQCTAFDGGLCTAAADGSGRRTLQDEGFVPDRADDGATLWHTSAYALHLRTPAGDDVPLGAGAMASWAP